MSCINPVKIPQYLPHYSGSLSVRCGKCADCRRFYAREWSIRCVLESKSYGSDNCWFCTFTYDDSHVRSNSFFFEGLPVIQIQTLIKKDYQDFFKRLRFRGLKFRYFLAGEYGGQTERPHFHVIFFGLHFRDLDVVRSEWGFGFVDFRPFLESAGFYVAGYVQKKLRGEDRRDESVLRVPSFSQASINPPLGWRYFYHLYKTGVISDESYFIKFNGFQYPVPRTFSRRLGKKSNILYLLDKERCDILNDSKRYESLGSSYDSYLLSKRLFLKKREKLRDEKF